VTTRAPIDDVRLCAAPVQPGTAPACGPHPAAVAGLPFLVALVCGSWAIGRPSLWSDELVTIEVAGRSVAQILCLLGHVDAVHGLYYLLMHPLVEFLGPSAAVVRAPSVLATAVAAGGLGLLGRVLMTPGTGLIAGIAYALTPVASQYALEARSYALVTAIAVFACLAFALALRGGRPLVFCSYIGLLVLLGTTHVFAFLLVGAHAVTVLACLAARRLSRRRALAWAASVLAAALALAPLAVVASSESGAVEWIRPPDAPHLWASVLGVTGGAAATFLVGLLVTLAAAWWRPTTMTLMVALPWAFVPPLALLALSQLQPLFVPRYLLFCVPAVALLVAACLSSGPRPIMVVAGCALLAFTIPAQAELRRPDSKWHDVTPIVRVLGRQGRPGDSFLVAPANTRLLASAYPKVFASMIDVARARTGAETATLNGREVATRVLLRRLRATDRVWIVERLNGDHTVRERARARAALLNKAGITRVAGRWHAKNMRLTLHTRDTR
jgi:mannosyltransferase